MAVLLAHRQRVRGEQPNERVEIDGATIEERPPSRKLAVDGISATIWPGVITAFLGPNGPEVDDDADDPRPGPPDVRSRAGQRPTVRQLPAPLAEVDALLNAKAVESSRSADRRGGAGAYRLPEHAVRVVGLRASGGC